MESIKDYWIQQIQETKEFQEIAIAEDPEVEKLKEDVPKLLDEEFIKTSTEIGISRREKLLYITPKKSDTLEDRRLAVESRWGKRTPITYRKLEGILDTMIGEETYDMTLFNNEYYLQVELYLENYKSILEISKMLRRLVPANLGIFALPVKRINTNLYFGMAMTEYEEQLINTAVERKINKKLKFGMAVTEYEEQLINTVVAEKVKSNFYMFSTVIEREKEVVQ